MSTGSTASRASPPQKSASPDAESIDRRKEEKKAVRGSRQVKKLSAEQLARKRAHDRDAQRNSRKRTIEHIERLEHTVSDHVDHNRQLAMRNEQLELRLARLEARLNTNTNTTARTLVTPAGKVDAVDSSTLPFETVPPVYESEAGEPPGSHWDSSSQISSYALQAPIYTPSSGAQDVMGPSGFDLSGSPQTAVYVPTLQTSYGDSAYSAYPKSHFGTEYYDPQQVGRPAPITPEFYFPEPSTRSSNFAPSHQNDALLNHQAQPSLASSCWQRQPSVYAWQLSTKLCSPDNPLDELVLSIVQTQRHAARVSNIRGEALVGPKTPSLNALFGRAEIETTHPLIATMTRGMHQLRQFITSTPNQICGLLAPYRLYQWMIEPTQETYHRLFEWQAPRPLQLLIKHPAWMDFPPWGKFRDRIIENQDLYGTVEFQLAYMANMRITWPYEPTDMFCLHKDGQLRSSPLLEKHLGNIENLVMAKPFMIRYPEFEGLCRVQEDDT